METIQAVVESKEIVAEVQSEQVAAEIVRSLSAIEMSCVGGGTLSNVYF